MLRYVLKTGADLSAREIAAWQGLLPSRADFSSPYFSPDFFAAVAQVTKSARVLVIEDGGKPVGFLPHHRRVGGLGTPIGSQLCDIHGLIAGPLPELDTCQIMQAAGLSMLPWRHAAPGQPALGAGTQTHAFHIVDFSRGYAAYDACRKIFAKSAMRAIRVRKEKAERQFGSVTHKFWDFEDAHLAQLISWKVDQLRQTRQPGIFGHGWVRSLIDALYRERSGNLKGQLSCLFFGDELAAAHFGLRTPSALHYWFPGYDSRFGDLSPGNILLHMMIESAAAEGCTAVHLGPGDYRYKLEFGNASIPVASGVVYGSTLPARAARAAGQAIHSIERILPQPIAALPMRVIRRLDRQLAFQV